MTAVSRYGSYTQHDRVTFRELPTHWDVVRGRHLVRIQTGSGDTVDADPSGKFPFFVRSDNPLRSNEWEFDTTAVLTAGDGAGVAKVFHLVSGRFMAHQRVYVLDAFRRVTPRFFFYSFSSAFRLMALDGSARSTVDSVRRHMIADMPFGVPPLSEQERIVDYLDRETAQIDSIITEQERLIDLLHERRDAEWGHAWDRLAESHPSAPLRRLIISIADGPFGSSLTSAHYSDFGTRVVRLGNIGINAWKDTDAAYIDDEYASQLSQHAVVPGDVVVAGLGDDRWPLGRAAVVPSIGPAIVKADCYRLRPLPSVTPQYLAWAMSAPPSRTQFGLLARGSTRARLNTSVVLQAQVPFPPLEIQRQVVETSRERTAKIDQLIIEAERFIGLARERRSALITAVVTGQIEIPEAS